MSTCCLGARGVWGRGGRRGSIVLCVWIVQFIILRVVRVVLLGVGLELSVTGVGGVSGMEGHPSGAVVRLEATTTTAAGYKPGRG